LVEFPYNSRKYIKAYTAYYDFSNHLHEERFEMPLKEGIVLSAYTKLPDSDAHSSIKRKITMSYNSMKRLSKNLKHIDYHSKVPPKTNNASMQEQDLDFNSQDNETNKKRQSNDIGSDISTEDVEKAVNMLKSFF
jgi:hypothetical protein